MNADQEYSSLYRITPRDAKSVEYIISVFSKNKDGSTRSWSVTETWQSGQGFRLVNEPVTIKELMAVDCDPEIGWGNELEDLCAVDFNFDDSFNDDEQEEIEAHWNVEDEEGRWRLSWLLDSCIEWQVDEHYIRILGPIKIDLVDEQTGFVIEEDVMPKDESGILLGKGAISFDNTEIINPPKDSNQGG